MASWADKKPNSVPQRRKWNLEDRTSLRNLKYHLAEDGCSEVQYDLARQLLDETIEPDQIGSSAQGGIHWLLRAAQQGHEGALELLDECYRSRRGITDLNEREVRSCLSMSPGERAARRAARELFACLSNGEQYITAAQLETKMREIYKLQKRRKRDHDAEEDDRVEENGHRSSSPPIHRIPRDDLTSPEVITEANIVAAAVNYAHGHLPHVSHELTLSTPDPQTLDHIPCFHRPLFHPLLFFSLLYHRFLKLMASLPGTAFSNFQVIFIFVVYSIFASENLVQFAPISVYYISHVVMIISTFKMLKTKHEFIDFRIWSGLFLSYGDERVDVETSEHLFIKNNSRPYLFFFGSFIVNIMIQPLVNDQLILHSEITVVSFLLIFISMLAFMYTTHPFPDYTVLFSFGVNVLAKYPYEMDEVVITGWRFLDLKVPTFSSFVIGNGIEFCLNCRTFFYLLIPGFLIYLAHRNNWRGTYRYLIPHCVTLSWLQLCIVSSQGATMFGLVRATLGVAGLLLFLPLFGIVTLLIPIFASLEWLSLTDPTIRLTASIVAAIIALIFSCVMAANHRTEKYITFLQITVCVLATVFLTYPYMTSNFDLNHSKSSQIFDNLIRKTNEPHPDDVSSSSSLTWQQFYKYCHQPAWEHMNKIQTQLRCSHLDRTPITWEGQITDVEITRIINHRADFIKNYLPTTIADFLICFYGEKNSVVCSDKESCDDIKTFLDDQKRCHLNKWNRYEYEVTVSMQHAALFKRAPEVVLKADDMFGNFTLRAHRTDRIWFKGLLKNAPNSHSSNGARLGKDRPIVEVTAIGCNECVESDMPTIRQPDGLKINPRMRDLMRGVKYLLNVLFNPLLTFK